QLARVGYRGAPLLACRDPTQGSGGRRRSRKAGDRQEQRHDIPFEASNAVIDAIREIIREVRQTSQSVDQSRPTPGVTPSCNIRSAENPKPALQWPTTSS